MFGGQTLLFGTPPGHLGTGVRAFIQPKKVGQA
jgi:hypothetical protein